MADDEAMSTRRELDRRINTLAELSGILGSLRTLALAETRKLARLQAYQASLADAIEQISADFFGSHGAELPQRDARTTIVVAVGSERGFVGDFNKRIIQMLPGDARVLAVGHRLYSQCRGDPRLAVCLEGPAVAEEVEEVLTRLLATVDRFDGSWGTRRIKAMHLAPGNMSVRHVSIFPPFQVRDRAPATGHATRLYLQPRTFVRELVRHYLLITLRDVLLSSFLAENEARAQHLDRAVRRLEEKMAFLELRRQSLRQEEITQEIEIILLSAEAVGGEADRFNDSS